MWADAWKIGRRDGAPFTGIEVDMSHYVVETIEQTLRHVLHDFDPDPLRQLMVGGILHGIPLHGESLVAAGSSGRRAIQTACAWPSSVPTRRSKASGGSMPTPLATTRWPAIRCSRRPTRISFTCCSG